MRLLEPLCGPFEGAQEIGRAHVELQSRGLSSYAVFLFKCAGDHRDLPSFPPRRSSVLRWVRCAASRASAMRLLEPLCGPFEGAQATPNRIAAIARVRFIYVFFPRALAL